MGTLDLASRCREFTGAVVECGVWRGGMSAAIAEVLGAVRSYYLFDSFEGLPPAKEIDGAAAIYWQSKADPKTYYNNCRAEEEQARRAMALAGIDHPKIIRGWFSETLSTFPTNEPIALLRLDGDWYDSTRSCLEALFELVVPGGLIIVDDYFTWDGCSRAVHEYLASRQLPDRLRQSEAGVCYIRRTNASRGKKIT